MSWLLLGLALVLILAALRLRRSTGLPWKRIAWSDTGALRQAQGRPWRRAEQPLFARRYGLVGKPDYLMDAGRYLIPVEVKPGRRAAEPYPSDLMQLAAYCLLVEETSGARPPYGLLRYAETTFKVRFDDRLRSDLLAVLDEMQTADAAVASHRSHQQPGRCRGCGFVRHCNQALV